MLHGGNGWFLGTDTSPAQTIFWYPSDGGGGMPRDCERILQKVEYPVAMAEYGKKQVKEYYNMNVRHIPHGTEKNRFFKLPDEQRFQLRLRRGFHDKFVIGVVARNQPRKFLDRTMKAMYLIKDKIPNAILFLHLDPNDPAQVFPIRDLIARYNLENRVVFSGMTALKGFDWDQMNEVYNLMDVMFLSTSGEGFGIPIIESMSCEVPVVATDYTTTPELVLNNNAGLGVRLSGTKETDMFKSNLKDYDNLMLNGTITGNWNVERGICDVQDACDKITFLYNNPDIRKEMGKNGRKAVEEKYDFETIVGPLWEKLLNEIIEKT